MVRECVEYMLIKNDKGELIAPNWISEGGFFPASDQSLVGFIAADRNWYVPDSVVKLTEAQFIQRGMTIHSKAPFNKQSAVPTQIAKMNNTEATTMLRNFYQSKIAE